MVAQQQRVASLQLTAIPSLFIHYRKWKDLHGGSTAAGGLATINSYTVIIYSLQEIERPTWWLSGSGWLGYNKIITKCTGSM